MSMFSRSRSLPALLTLMLTAATDLAAQTAQSRTGAPVRSMNVLSEPLATSANRRSDPFTAVLAKLGKAESGAEKAAAVEELREAVGEFFHADLKRREKDLRDIRQRVDRMQEQLSKRGAAKSDIVELQLKSFSFEAEGLGLFESKHADPGGNRLGTRPTGSRVSLFTSSAAANQQRQLVRATQQQQTARSRVDQLRAELAAAETTAARSAVQDELRQAMDEYFDEDLERRQNELAKIRQRIKEMEQRLAKRTTAKPEIIELQVEMFVREAEGLGFFGKGPAFQARSIQNPPAGFPRRTNGARAAR